MSRHRLVLLLSSLLAGCTDPTAPPLGPDGKQDSVDDTRTVQQLRDGTIDAKAGLL